MVDKAGPTSDKFEVRSQKLEVYVGTGIVNDF